MSKKGDIILDISLVLLFLDNVIIHTCLKSTFSKSLYKIHYVYPTSLRKIGKHLLYIYLRRTTDSSPRSKLESCDRSTYINPLYKLLKVSI